MSETHITREMLRAVARGDLPSRVLVEFAVKHLVALCPSCRQEIAAWERERKRPFPPAAAGVRPPIPRRPARETGEREGARRDFRQLLEMPHAERLARIDRAHRRFRGTILAAMLLEESKKAMAADPERARELAETADAALRRTMAGPGVSALLARASAYLGNADRIRGDSAGAAKRFGFARSLIWTEGVTDPSVHAEIDACEALLHMQQGSLAEAETLLSRAIALHLLSGTRGERRYETALVTLDLARVYLRQGRSTEVKQLAGELHELFSGGQIHQEAMAALLLFEDEARRGTLTPDLIEDLAAYLKAARDRPSFRFQRKLPS